MEELLYAIRNLPEEHLVKIQGEISRTLQRKNIRPKKEYLAMLAKGPVMTKDQFDNHKQNRKRFNSWRTT